MEKIRLTDVGPDVRAFLSNVFQGNGAEIEDESGRTCGHVVPHRDPTPAEENTADELLEKLRAKTGEAMRRHGVTEDDILREVLEND